ncbi:MAG: DUF488 domain-containing protein [Armatimonadota bacterium]|nr:DUF488 domain-containing protein [Armatimonadota bacterium]MCX7776961.1 DUF488 domain-containing protein [Armatimonadota bacterium]MDW8024795.1 DUF488 domain-containing protein [Armatimonadota bacterium]
MRCIYTVGHSTRTPEEMKSLLMTYGIKVVVDVRRFPKSTKHPHFNREAIQVWLSDAGIKYVWLGDKLGGYRRGGYETHMNTHEFEDGIRELESIAETMPLAVMCAERFPWKCHRRFIAAALHARGWHVIHIIDENRSLSQTRQR